MAPEGSKVRVLIADDSAVTRFGIRTALEHAGFEVCAEAADGDAAVQLATAQQPDVCVLDVMMPKGGGIRAVREIARDVPSTKILMLTGSEAGEDVRDALRQGASGYVYKDEDLAAITDAVRKTVAGETPMSTRAVRDLLNEERVGLRRMGLANGRGSLLSDREWQVLELLAGGRSDDEVALRLGIEPDAVAGDLSRACDTLEVPDRRAALELVRGLQSQ
ncbi:MAG: response regulator transcription factor [Solirubrobacteraceae bacterium]